MFLPSITRSWKYQTLHFSPLILRLRLRSAMDLTSDTGTALLITAQLAAWGFWSYFFLFCRRWNISPALQICGALLIAAHPAAFFLIAGYSESLFLMALLGFIYWSIAEGRSAKFWAAVHGIVMSATRIVGIVCAAFPLVRSVFQTRWRGLLEPKPWFRTEKPAIVMTLRCKFRRRRIFHLFSTALGSLGYLYAYAGSRLGNRSRLFGGV